MAGFSRGFSSCVLSSSYLSNVDCDDDIDFKDENAKRKLDYDGNIDFQHEIAEREMDYDAKRVICDDEQGEKAYERERKLDYDDDSESEDENAERETEYDYDTFFEDEHEERFYDDDSRIEDENAEMEMEYDNYTDFEDEHEERFYDDDSEIEDENAEREMEYDNYTDFEDEREERFYDDDITFKYEDHGCYEYEILEHETSILALLMRLHNQQVRQLAATVSEKSKESQDLKTELEINRRRAEAERLQLEKSHKLELEAVRVKARIIEEAYNQANLETIRALEKREAELRQLDKELREKESHINSAAEKNRLQAQVMENRQLREALANQQVLLQHKEAEKIELLQNHEEEILRLADHAQKEALKLAKSQQIEMEREQLQTMLETGKLFDTIKQDLGHERKKMEELEKKLAELQSTQEYQEETITTLTVKERESNDEVVDGREIAVQVIQDINEAKLLIEAALKKKDQLDKTKQPQPRVEVKRAGAIDDTAWSRAFKRKHKNDTDWGVKMTEAFSRWEARIRNSEFQPFKTVQIGEDKWEQQIDDENGELASLKKTYGKEVYNSVTTALMEIEEYNASGRYPIPVAWNFKKSRKASLKEVIQYLGRIIDSLVAPEVFAYLGRTIESLMAPGAPRKRSRN